MTKIKEIKIIKCKSCTKMIPKDSMYCPYCEEINNKNFTVLNRIEYFKYIVDKRNYIYYT